MDISQALTQIFLEGIKQLPEFLKDVQHKNRLEDTMVRVSNLAVHPFFKS
ncbi:MAG: hypothetical protein R6U57_13465 [Anaerolineales bacterium]